ncbi:hypothetical protein [Pseudovibrio sp. POLY-S9]|uniref:hypothetical protein n=1 Tax=Pseudovibrio sp. POLY-S9 TaxID=1576596 RepID=UPI00070D0BA6|nr:hypothetical protein [Pseudovibrio sp. POLY-S9]
MFSRKTRKGLLGGVALALAGLMAGEAGAATGVLITSTYCDRFTNSRNQIWTENNLGADNVYYMKDNGAVIQLSGPANITQVDDLIATAHGNCDGIGPFAKDAFAQHLKTARDTGADFNKLVFFSCSSAATGVSGHSLIDEVGTKFPGTKRIVGWPRSGYFSGSDDASFANAQYTSGADFAFIDPSREHEALGRIADMDYLWNTKITTPIVGPLRSVQAACNLAVGSGNDQDLKARMLETIAASRAVLTGEVVPNMPGSTVLGWGHQLLDYQDNAKVCGADIDGAGTAVPCNHPVNKNFNTAVVQ